MPRYVGVTLGPVEGDDGPTLEADATLEAAPSVLFDALVLPGGAQAVETLAKAGQTMEFVKDQYRHRNGDAQRRARAGLSRPRSAPSLNRSGCRGVNATKLHKATAGAAGSSLAYTRDGDELAAARPSRGLGASPAWRWTCSLLPTQRCDPL